MSTAAIVSVPSAIAATACTPPSTKISSAPPKCIAATIAGCGPPLNGGAQAMIRFTPATLAVRRGHHRVAPARHVAADARDRNVPMAEHDARKRLNFEVAHRRLLLFGEVPHLRLGEF